MNKKQYNSVIEWTLQQEQSEDTLTTARAVCNNLGVALPQGDLPQVAATLKSNDYMGWRACSMQEAQAAADNGTAAIGIGEDRIVVLSANDEEQPATQTASVMALDENTSAFAVDGLRYYSYSYGTTDNAQLVISWACHFLGKTETEIENETQFSLSDGQWCVDFVRLCLNMAGVYAPGYNIKKTSSSTDLRNWYRTNKPSWFHEGAAGIQPGDIVFVASSASSTDPYHTCLALSGMYNNGEVETINGNWGNTNDSRVRVQTMPISGCTINWYVHPDYQL